MSPSRRSGRSRRRDRGPAPGYGGMAQHVAIGDARLGCGVLLELEHEADRFARRDRRVRKTALPARCRASPILADEDQVERHRRVLHPEADRLALVEDEQHAVVDWHSFAGTSGPCVRSETSSAISMVKECSPDAVMATSGVGSTGRPIARLSADVATGMREKKPSGIDHRMAADPIQMGRTMRYPC